MSQMRAEIREQPEALERTLRAELRTFQALKKRFAQSRPRLVVLAARGTSDNAAQFGRYLIEITTGIPVALAAPSVSTLYHSKLDYRDTLLVAISQSGESTDTNIVLQEGKECGAFTIGVTNEADSTLAKLADQPVLVRAGREKSVAATKTYTGQLMTLYLLAWALGGSEVELDHLRRLPEWTQQALGIEKEIRERAERFCFIEHAVVIGRGLNYANAFEFALKLMETCYVVAERFSSADLLHGPIAMVERSFPAFLFAPAGPAWPSLKELVDRLHTLKAETFVITDRSNPETPPDSLRLKTRLREIYTPIPFIVPAQLFAASLAEVKRLDPDRPRGLTKVTLTL